ncbi:MAG: arginase family protein [Gammaproteobacteria bacterium]
MPHPVCLYHGVELERYNFGPAHPFGPRRLGAFWDEALRQGLVARACVCAPMLAEPEAIERFHTPDYVTRVKIQSKLGVGYLDFGDTPAFIGVYDAASTVVGTTLDAVARIMRDACRRAFVPIAGLHHARRDAAAGFCVFNDCGVAIETLRSQYGVRRIAYVDIDAHHGDGVFYAFEDDADMIFADLHEDGRHLYPGTGAAEETGRGAAVGTKLNIPLPAGADDAAFFREWPRVESLLRDARPEFILLQCGADSVAGDPITHMAYSAAAHAHATTRLGRIADELGHGRLLALGGGGYDLDNIATAWCAVLGALLGDAEEARVPAQ